MLKRLVLQNVEGHKKSILDFSPGVNFIVGSSNVGKSSIFRAIRWVISNRQPKGKLTPWDDPKATTKVLMHFDDASVARIKGPKTNEYRVGRQVFKAVGMDVPEEVQRVLRLSDVNFQPQHVSHFLLSERPSEITARFNRLANFEEIDAVVKAANAHKRELSTLKTRAQEDLARVEVDLSRLAAVDRADAMLSSIEELEEEAVSLEEGLEALEDLLESITCVRSELACLALVDAALRRFERIKDGMAALETLEEDIRDLKVRIRAVEDLEEELEVLDPVEDALVDAQVLQELMERTKKVWDDWQELEALLVEVEDIQGALRLLEQFDFGGLMQALEEMRVQRKLLEELEEMVDETIALENQLTHVEQELDDLIEEVGEQLKKGCPLRELCPHVS